MSTPHPLAAFDREALVRFQRETEASTASRLDLVATDGRRLVHERAPAPGVVSRLTVHAADGTGRPVVTEWAPSAERPAGYPASLPFVPGRAVGVSVLGSDDDVAVSWEDVADPAALAAELHRACLADGWRAVAPEGAARRALVALAHGFLRHVLHTEFVMHALVRGERQRVLQASGRDGRAGVVTLGEMPRTAAADGAAVA